MAMTRWVRSVGILGLMSVCVGAPGLAHAADDVSLSEDVEATGSKEAAPAETKEAAPPADTAADDSPVEDPTKEYHFVGLRYRGIVVPKFIENLFADGGRTVYVHAFGPEFVIRKDDFEFGLSPWLAFYSMDDTPFKGATDPETSWEYISSNIKMLYLTSDFLWSKPVSPKFAVNYGFGAGLGFTFGDLHRAQSYPQNGQPGDPSTYLKCPGPINDPGNYCRNPTNNHYGNYSEPSWFNGGGKWSLFPWLALQTGFRFKPSKKFVGRLDVGFGTSGFFFGLGADYGL